MENKFNCHYNMRTTKDFKDKAKQHAKNKGMDLSTLIRVLLIKDMKENSNE